MSKQYFSNRAAAKWLKSHVNFLDDEIKINTAFVKRLQTECRLLPAKHGLFGSKYLLAQLQKYVNETQPR